MLPPLTKIKSHPAIVKMADERGIDTIRVIHPHDIDTEFELGGRLIRRSLDIVDSCVLEEPKQSCRVSWLNWILGVDVTLNHVVDEIGSNGRAVNSS